MHQKSRKDLQKLNVHLKLKNDEELCENLIQNLPASLQDACHKHAAEDHEDLTQWEIFLNWLKVEEHVAKHACLSHALTDHAMAQEQPGARKHSQPQLPATKLKNATLAYSEEDDWEEVNCLLISRHMGLI